MYTLTNLCYIVLSSPIMRKMMNTVKDVEESLRHELLGLPLKQLRKTAAEIGVRRAAFKSREELIEQCVILELYAYTH